MHNTWFVIFSIGLAQGVFLIIALLGLRGRRRISIHLLVILMFCFLSLIFTEWLKTFYDITVIPHMYRSGETIPLLIGPLFLIYIMSVVEPDFKWNRKLWWHFTPFILFFFLFLPFYIKPYEFKVEYIKNLNGKAMPLGLALFSILKGLHTIIYFLFSLLLLKQNSRESLKREKSWLKVGLLKRLVKIQIWALVAIYLIVGLEQLFPDVGIEPDRISSTIITVAFFVLAFTIILFPNSLLPAQAPFKYFSSSLKSEEKQRILEDLQSLLGSGKPYLNAELSLAELSEMLNVSANQLSQVINEKLGKNFHQLINEYRVEEVKKNIHDSSRTLLGIAFESGFNSKSSFNRIFKEFTGLTPSKYKKLL